MATYKMKAMTIIMVMIVASLVVLMGTFSFLYKYRQPKYEKLTEELESVAKEYVENNNLYPIEDSEVKISLSELQEKELIGELKYKKDKCDGFVIVTNNGSYKYEGYISCKYYITSGYKKAK